MSRFCRKLFRVKLFKTPTCRSTKQTWKNRPPRHGNREAEPRTWSYRYVVALDGNQHTASGVFIVKNLNNYSELMLFFCFVFRFVVHAYMLAEQISKSKRQSFAFYENDIAEQIRILLSVFILITYRHKIVNFVSDSFCLFICFD